MALKDRFFSVLTELARNAQQPMPLNQWEKYLRPGQTLERGGVRFPLRADEVRYGPFSRLLSDPTLQNQGNIKPEDLANLLEDIGRQESGGYPKFRSLLPAGSPRGPWNDRATSGDYMSYKDQWQLPGEKLAQSEELTLQPGSEFVPSTRHFGGQEGLLSWHRATRRPLSGAIVIPEPLQLLEEPSGYGDQIVLTSNWNKANPGTGLNGHVMIDERPPSPDTPYRASFQNQQQYFKSMDEAKAWVRSVQVPKLQQNVDRGTYWDRKQLKSGETAYNIEEIQSDWHQRARKEGYQLPENQVKDNIRKGLYIKPNHRDPETGDFIENPNMEVWRERQPNDQDFDPDIRQRYLGQLRPNEDLNAWVERRYNEIPDKGKGIPYAPYKDTYAELELRKSLARAVENGDSYVTWTTGDQQADRYGQALRKSVDEIHWLKSLDGKYTVIPLKNDREIRTDERFKNLTEDQLEDLLGVEIAKKIAGGEGRYSLDDSLRYEDLRWRGDLTPSERNEFNVLADKKDRADAINAGADLKDSGIISGDNLTVGGSGMRLFYDRKVPEAARKLAAQYGGEVTKVKIPSVAKLNMPGTVQDRLARLQSINVGSENAYEEFDHSHGALMRDMGVTPEMLEDGNDEFGFLDVYSTFGNLIDRHNDWLAGRTTRDNFDAALVDYRNSISELKRNINRGQSSDQEVWALKITPQMREKILKAGLPLFSGTGALAVSGLYGDDAQAQVEGYAEGGRILPSEGYATGGPAVPDYFNPPLHPWLQYFGLDNSNIAPPPRLTAAPLAPRRPYAPDPTDASRSFAGMAAESAVQDENVPALDPTPASTPGLYGVGDYGVPPYPPETPALGRVPSAGDDLANTGDTPPPAYLAALEGAESGGNPNAAAATSSARGPYQFTAGTWADLMAGHPELKLTPEGRTDPAQATAAVQAFTTDNAAVLKTLGAAPTDANLRILHVLGAKGGPRLLYALESAPADSAARHADPAALAANPDLFYRKNGALRTVRELFDLLTARFPGRTFAEAYLNDAG